MVSTTTPAFHQPAGRTFRAVLWSLQAVLALVFAFAGATKLLSPLPELASRMAWVADVQPTLVRFIGLSELAGAVGLLLPALTRIRPQLTGWAAMGLTLVMVLAGLFHLARSEWAAVPPTVVLGALAGFVAWGRLIRTPIPHRDLPHD